VAFSYVMEENINFNKIIIILIVKYDIYIAPQSQCSMALKTF